MRKIYPGMMLLSALICAHAGHTAEPNNGSATDYDRAKSLGRLFANKVLNARVQPAWSPNSSRIAFRIEKPDGSAAFEQIEAETGKRSPAFDHKRLAEALSKKFNRQVNENHLPVSHVENVNDESFLFDMDNTHWRCAVADYALTNEGKVQAEENGVPAPGRERRPMRRFPEAPRPSGPVSQNGKWSAFIKENNLGIRAKDSNEEIMLTKDGTADDAYSSPFFWSQDAQHLVAMKIKKGGDRKVYLVESSPRDQLQPKLNSYDYLKPGDKIPQAFPQLFDIANKKQIPVDTALFPNPWMPDFGRNNYRWDADAARFLFLYNQRGHQVMRLLAIDAKTGAVSPVINEECKTFFDYSGKEFLRFIDESREVIWMSERDGWNHLYLIDEKTGAVKNQITKGDWVVRRVERVDDKARQIWFQAGGIYPEQDPYYVHFCRINFDGTGLVKLTEGDGTHEISYSPDGKYLLDTYSRVDLPPVTELRRASDGKRVCEVARATIPELLKTGWRAPERFVAKGRDGTTDIYGIIVRPMNFDPNKKYPIVEEIYAGPHDSFAPKKFTVNFTRLNAFAELGFITVMLDGMGTSNRSKKFHDVCWQNLGDSGFPDRIVWIKAAAAKYPYMDLSRVGIFGGSAGGQSALRALEAHGDFYKAAVADCGCHDNRMDKIWWNEQWMGWPIGPHYAGQSNVTNAKNLQGKVLLIVGEQDHNVDPASTMQVVNALIKADKDFDLLVVPGADHGIAESPYGSRRRMDFFVRNLMGVEPRHE